MSCLGKFGSDRSSIHLQRRWSHLYCAGFRERALPHACNDSIRQGKANEPASARQRCRSVPDRRTTPRPPATFPQVLCRGLHPKALLAKLGRIQRACGALMGARRGGGGRERLVGWLVRLGTNQARRRLVVTNLKDYGSCFSYRQRLTHARQRERRRRRRRQRQR